MEVVPAVLPKSFADLTERVELIAPYVDTIQIDVLDGRFVPGVRSWPYLGRGEEFSLLETEDIGLPQWDKVNYEADLMVLEPEKHTEEWVKAGASRIVAHLESLGNPASFIRWFRETYGNPEESPVSVELGFAIENDTSLDQLLPFIAEIDFVQLMGIARIGFQGEPFDERVLERITELREEYPDLVISIDGGVNRETAPLLADRGASRLVSGSFLFENPHPGAAVDFLASL
jgi:ribulose-phosphate 3-epimerase